LRLLTYNTHSCRGVDGIEDPARILAVIREAEADIIALQEVDQRTAADQDFLHRLRSMEDYAVVFDPTLTRPQGGAYGNALLSRWPIRSSVRLDLSVRAREPRGAIRAEIETPRGLVSATATHLGLRPAERREQVNRLLALPKAKDAYAQVLLGDFNEWWLWGRPLRRLHRHYGAAPSIRSFPSQWPIFHLDRIWVRPRRRLRSISTVRTALSRTASDHLPVMAELA
jgi:endonuclease/exonuclease/phosphatase family metal-dependent hydrolase